LNWDGRETGQQNVGSKLRALGSSTFGTLSAGRGKPPHSCAVLDEVCENVSRYEIAARTHVASKILEAATRGNSSPDALKQVGREALSHPATMWR